MADRDIYPILLRIEGDVGIIKGGMEGVIRTQEDHAARIRKLEGRYIARGNAVPPRSQSGSSAPIPVSPSKPTNIRRIIYLASAIVGLISVCVGTLAAAGVI